MLLLARVCYVTADWGLSCDCTTPPSSRRNTEGGWTWASSCVDGKGAVCVGGKVPASVFAELQIGVEDGNCETIPAGKKFTVDTAVGQSKIGASLQWEFMSEDKDCGFELLFTPAGGTDGGAPVVLLANERLDCNIFPESGVHECTVGAYPCPPRMPSPSPIPSPSSIDMCWTMPSRPKMRRAVRRLTFSLTAGLPPPYALR